MTVLHLTRHLKPYRPTFNHNQVVKNCNLFYFYDNRLNHMTLGICKSQRYNYEDSVKKLIGHKTRNPYHPQFLIPIMAGEEA